MTRLKQFSSGQALPALERLEALTGKIVRTTPHAASCQDEGIESARETAFLYLLLDSSSSMDDGSKMEEAAEGAMGLAIEAVKAGYAVGLIHFASTPYRTLAPVRALDDFPAALSSVSPAGTTDMAAAIELGMSECATLQGEKIMCIVTDGLADDGDEACAAAKEAKRAGIDIMAIGTDDADVEFLQEISTRTELAKKVHRAELRKGIASMALLLPAPKER